MPFSYRDRLPICNYAGVYSIVCVVTGKVYVGSALVVRARLHAHRSMLRRGIHDNGYLQRAWDKHGEDKFKFGVLQGLRDQTEILIEREQFWMDRLGAAVGETGYNLNPTAGASPMRGRTHTEDARRRISEANKTRDLSYLTDAAAKANRGRKRSDETRKKISEGHKRRTGEEVRQARSDAAKKGWKTAKDRLDQSNATTS